MLTAVGTAPPVDAEALPAPRFVTLVNRNPARIARGVLYYSCSAEETQNPTAEPEQRRPEPKLELRCGMDAEQRYLFDLQGCASQPLNCLLTWSPPSPL